MLSTVPVTSPRIAALEDAPTADGQSAQRLNARAVRYVASSVRGLGAMYLSEDRGFPQTVRRGTRPGQLVPEGENLRYAAIAALGLSCLDQEAQRSALAGTTAADLCATLGERGVSSPDLGGAALVAWACAEVTGTAPDELVERLVREVKGALPQPTVDYAWALTALLAVRELADVSAPCEQAAERMLAAQGARGIFPHALPRQVLGRFRAHVGCFADQVYPIQALARYHAATGDSRALAAADACAARIVELQGPAGQWWWHYDVRTGDVVEGYPVYSVHQHAMAPMALFDLADAGGQDHGSAIALGLRWIEDHPESAESLLDDTSGVIWRKVGRHEKRKAVRILRSVSTSFSPGLRLGPLDRVFPPGPVDRECRPYELGWLLYAWLGGSPAGRAGGPATAAPTGG
jgi:hypothetical protein